MKQLLVALVLAKLVIPFSHSVQAQTLSTASERQVVSSADQMPRHLIRLEMLPSQYLHAPRAEMQTLVDSIEKTLRDDLAKFDIQDATTKRSLVSSLITLTEFSGRWAELPALIEQVKALHDKPGSRAMSGVLTGIMSEQQMDKRDAAWVQEEVRKRFSALKWSEVADEVKSLKGRMELLNPSLINGAFEQKLDESARKADMNVPRSMAMTIVAARLQNEQIVPFRDQFVAGLQAVIEMNKLTDNKADIWSPRLFAIAPTAVASEVGVGIWDSGVDLNLFKSTNGRGIAFDWDYQPASELLRPLGEVQAKWPQLKALIKGAFDLRAAIDTNEAQMYKQFLATIKVSQVDQFQEELNLVSYYLHGTHVAGIAVEGNPFARVFTATMHWSHLTKPRQPTLDRSRRTAAAYKQIVQSFKDEKLRVVNMSWRYGPKAYEKALASHQVGGNPEERRKLARELFEIERDALQEAVASAPEILFVAGSGNEDNSADFEEYIPAGLTLPNLLTVGAVDRAGEETNFSSFGKTVLVHANGSEVESFVPGGDRMKLAGTSTASPQVANLAAKLFALKPELTVSQVRAAILAGADKKGRVNLINPRKSAELLGLKH